MPNHWESSARPLFVKTVYVNGSRHAVLFEKDPLLRRGSSPFKKTSRPNSSISFSSDLSVGTSNSEEFKRDNLTQSQNKDLSTELQSCLVKLKLASASKRNSREDKCFCVKEVETIQGIESSKQKRNRNREKRKRCEREESGASKLSARKNSCYIYNLENYNGKKNYCFVKISSQPPELVLNCCCCCCCDSDQNHTCDRANKNMVISATIHNLVMTPDGRGNFFPFENAELYWNNYVTTSFYNSFAERVLQWLNLARKRKKQNEKLNGAAEEDSSNGTERIFSGKSFAEEIRKTESFFNSDNRIAVKEDKFTRNNSSESDVKSDVIGEPNIETLISKDLDGNASLDKTSHKMEDFDSKREHSSENSSTKTNFSYLLTVHSKDTPAKRSNIPRSNKSALKIQDLLLNCHPGENYSKRKAKEASSQKSREKENDEEEDLLITTLNNWTGEVGKKNVFVGKFDKQPRCHCNRKLHESGDKIKNQILTESSPERYQKSINNPNSTRGRPVLIQNLLSPQQPNKMSYLQEEKIVWASEKNTGRPQLHIFMPSTALRDQSDDSMSDCDNYFNM